MANFQNLTLSNFNATLLNDTSLCTVQTCPLVLDGERLAHLDYLPSVAGNGLFAGLFGLLILLQVFLGIRYRTIGYAIGMFGGLLCEIIGYTGRVLMHSNPFIDANFIMYLCCLTIGPAFLTASIYLCLSRIIIIYSEPAARFKPATYTFFFIFCDFVALTLQGAGGGVAATANTASGNTLGKNLLIAGLAFQVVSLSVFALLCLDLYLRFRNIPAAHNASFTAVRTSRKFSIFLYTLAAATLFIYVRSCFRCAELSQGFDSKLANSEVTFMVLEGAMIALATTLLTALHPGVVMGRETWAAANWSAGGKREDESMEKSSGGKKWWKSSSKAVLHDGKMSDPNSMEIIGKA